MIAGESVGELVPAAVEITVEHSSPSPSELELVVPESRDDATVEAYPGAQPGEQTKRAEGAAEDLRQVARLRRGAVDDEYPDGNSNRSQHATG
jgi:hypothetical protein